jgi:predicted RNA binding protein YcfA (HicA-like mRNA interferase family)
MDSTLRKFLHELRAMGWIANRTNGNHIRLTHPEHGMIIMGSTPNSGRYMQTTRALINRKMKGIQ